jgi:hypothetical protein
MTEAMFNTWKQAKIVKDEMIRGTLNMIADQYGYIIEDGFGLHIQRKYQAGYRQERYAEVSYTGFGGFQISTVSSHWNVSEATIFMKQLKEATECAAELNNFLGSLDHQLKKEFKAEMEQLQKGE